jgi:fumarylacetoacetase
MTELDETHDAGLQSWVASADGHSDFPIQNLPYGLFSPPAGGQRAGVAIGNHIVDLAALAASGLLEADAERAVRVAANSDSLNAFLALGAAPRRALRRRLSALLRRDNPHRTLVGRMIYEAAKCELHLPAQIGDYSDFYVGIHHATAVGRQFRPDNPLLPNYKWVPIGYHGRASSICPSGSQVRRPRGQQKPADRTEPTFEPTQALDFELELGVWIGPGNDLGRPITMSRAADHIAGFCLLNDWSARDIQAWEYQPLGPFLAKNFATTISPWIVTPEALAPFRTAPPPRSADDPQPLAYLVEDADARTGGLSIELEVLLSTPNLREAGVEPLRISLSNAQHMYWTPAQMIAHHTSGGCNLRPGDLIGTGTLSGPDQTSCGSLLEIVRGGKEPLLLPNGEQRTFLRDGDEIVFRARCRRESFVSIGFGECRGLVTPASS